MAERYTLAGTTLPGEEAPTLLFHKWQAYDRFETETRIDSKGKRHILEAFARKETGHAFLARVAGRVQAAGQEKYDPWYERYHDACNALDARVALTARTEWRLVIGWGTNPALEVGLTLDPLYGFPYLPGSAVKGLLHRMAELELGSTLPPPTAEVPGRGFAPPQMLSPALEEALQVRALFGSLHLRPDKPEQPGSALVSLEGWLKVARRLAAPPDHATREAWKALVPRLATACSDTATGGMVTCFDAVPVKGSFPRPQPGGPGNILTVDVLTPHEGKSPNPIHFLAVRDGVRFEFRYCLAAWPQGEPRDAAEEERAAALSSLDPATAGKKLDAWLTRGLAEHGLGGKTTAGYGYLFPEGAVPGPPPQKRPGDDLPAAERYALHRLPESIDKGRAINYLDGELKKPPSSERTAFVRRFLKLFPEEPSNWSDSPAPGKQKRYRLFQEAQAQRSAEEDEP